MKDEIIGISSPLLEITYNWPDKNGNIEHYLVEEIWPFSLFSR